MLGSIPLTEMSKSKKKLSLTEGDKPSDLEAQQDPGSVLSGLSKDSFEEDRGVTCTDIKLIMPTVLILLFTLFIMVTVIPYAFSSVIKQLQAVWALEEQSLYLSFENSISISMSAFRGSRSGSIWN